MNRRLAVASGASMALLLVVLLGVRATHKSPARARAAPSPTAVPTTPAGPDAGEDVACGVDRWPVKTGTDRDAAKVNMVPAVTTIAALNKIPAATKRPVDRRAATELRTYTVHGVIDAYRREPDSDYHLAIRDGLDTMIAEIPLPACLGKSPWRSNIETARAEFDAHLRATTAFQMSDVAVTVTGVLYADRTHGQRGAALDGYELHPVLAIAFD